ncbi:MAG: Asp-tRNA(Asn)/Glu-tRNA(Gln) amidotransferase subunit GatA [Clostridia bacterium]|nr:Asp-tRNA(Asn)/Glu-tRNA(Gln) amidotransferase subunit GatA [Clostridia bacterium]
MKNIKSDKLSNLTATQIVEKIKNGEISCKSLVLHYISNIEKFKHKNAILEVFDDAIEQAEKIDLKQVNGEKLPSLAGLPIIIKDNILYKGKICSCGSNFMKNFKAPYNATVIDKLLNAGVIILARSNMDEFAMGGSCENSAFGACLNAFDDKYVSGGSSGGSAVAVALDMCGAALGSDTGGSIRQPSAFNGLVGIKPTFGRVSRYGVVAYASSFDQVSPITKTVEDSALLLGVIAGKDLKDETSLENEVDDFPKEMKNNIKNLRIGILKEIKNLMNKTDYNEKYQAIIDWFKKQGAVISECSVPSYELALPVYYTLSSAEASSNLGRFDGIKYTNRAENADDMEQVYLKSRTEFLGKEVKRRIMFGNFVLSSGYYDAYYMKALKVRKLLKTQFDKIFEKFDVIISPTTFGEAFKLGEKVDKNPVEMYVEDMFTTIANVIGNPAISVPCGTGLNGLPLGLQIISNDLCESTLYNVADYFMKNYK